MATIVNHDVLLEDGPAFTPLHPGTGAEANEAAGQWTLIWHKFTRNKVAVFAGWVILFFFFVGLFAEFLAPGRPEVSRPQYTYAPPQSIGFFVPTEDGGRAFQPHVKGYAIEIDPVALRRTFVVDDEAIVPIGFFVRGAPYRMWGLWEMDRHLVGPLDPTDPMYLLGTDRLGRDLLTRLIYGTRVSMSIGLVGVSSASASA